MNIKTLVLLPLFALVHHNIQAKLDDQKVNVYATVGEKIIIHLPLVTKDYTWNLREKSYDDRPDIITEPKPQEGLTGKIKKKLRNAPTMGI